MKTVEEIRRLAPLTNCDDADEIAQWVADILHEVCLKSQARFGLYLLKRLSELSGQNFLRRETVPPLTLKVIDAASILIRELRTIEDKEKEMAGVPE